MYVQPVSRVFIRFRAYTARVPHRAPYPRRRRNAVVRLCRTPIIILIMLLIITTTTIIPLRRCTVAPFENEETVFVRIKNRLLCAPPNHRDNPIYDFILVCYELVTYSVETPAQCRPRRGDGTGWNYLYFVTTVVIRDVFDCFLFAPIGYRLIFPLFYLFTQKVFTHPRVHSTKYATILRTKKFSFFFTNS